MGRNELESAQKAFPGIPALSHQEKIKKGQVYFIHFCGRGPVKAEKSFAARMPDGNIFKVAFPTYRRLRSQINGSQLKINGEVVEVLEAGEPIGSIAIKNLQNREGRIKAKAIARAIVKYQLNKELQKKAKEKGGDGAQTLAWLAGNIYTAASEKADLRAWETLPEKILVGRVLLDPGEHIIEVEFTSSPGRVVTSQKLRPIKIARGQTKFIIFHSSF